MKKEKNKSETIVDKLKDKKYRAKYELIIYGIFIAVLLIGLNISGKDISSTNTIIPIKNKDNQEEKEDNLLLQITDNYEYDTKVNYIKKINDNTKEYSEHYYGKSSTNNLIINKEVNNKTSIIYKVEDEYYQKKSNNEEGFELLDDRSIYDLLPNKYLELDGIKKYLNMASLDSVTNNSDGTKIEIYHLKVSDIIKSHKGEEYIEISVITKEEQLKININYSNLYKVLDVSIEKCTVDIEYKNIGKVEKFDIINGE